MPNASKPPRCRAVAVSLPFEAGEQRKIPVEIVDDDGIESLKALNLDQA